MTFRTVVGVAALQASIGGQPAYSAYLELPTYVLQQRWFAVYYVCYTKRLLDSSYLNWCSSITTHLSLILHVGLTRAKAARFIGQLAKRICLLKLRQTGITSSNKIPG